MKVNIEYTYQTQEQTAVEIDKDEFLNWAYATYGENSNGILARCIEKDITPNQYFLQNELYLIAYFEFLDESDLKDLIGWDHDGITVYEVEVIDD